MRLHSYVVARDFGFAPNPFHGVCTLATCKPKIRKLAQVGDWVAGTGTAKRSRSGYLVYAMKVAETLCFEEYWSDSRFQSKKPNLFGSKKQAFGDNIYSRASAEEPWVQADSHHSFDDGSPNPGNIITDTSTNRVLISQEFVYFGGKGPEIPKFLRNFDGQDICANRGHKNQFSDELVQAFIDWIKSLSQARYVAEPLDWMRTP